MLFQLIFLVLKPCCASVKTPYPSINAINLLFINFSSSFEKQIIALLVCSFECLFYHLFYIMVQLSVFLVGLEKSLIRRMHYKCWLKFSLTVLCTVLPHNQVFHQFLQIIRHFFHFIFCYWK